MNKRTIVLVGMTVALMLAPQVCAEAIIVDHTCTDLSEIPGYWLEKAKNLTIRHTHTSHGGQIATGMDNIENPEVSLYWWDHDGTNRGQANGTIYVNTSGWWIDPAQFNASSGAPIQDAINNATDGYRIYVYNGSYTENVLVNKRLTLEGEGKDVVTVQAASAAEHVFNVTADYVNLSGFTATGATGNKKAGIYLGNGVDHCNISYNNVFNSNRGIHLHHSSNNTLTNNVMAGNTYNFGVLGANLSHYVHDIDTSNLVNGKPIRYWVGQQDQQVPDGAGYVGVANCDNITVTDMRLTGNLQAVLLAYSNDSRVENVTVLDNYCGIFLYNSSNNTLTGNNASNGDYGIYLQYSSNNSLTENIANSNANYNIDLVDSSSNNTLTDNNASDGDYCGIAIAYSSNNNTLTNNTANRNPGYSGILLYDSCNHNNLTGNTVSSNNEYGGIMLFYSCNHNNITGNTVSDNSWYGIYLYSSSDNQIYNNYFNDTNNACDYGSNTWNTTKTTGPNIIGGPYIGGNYWRNYAGSDSDGDGFGDTPYNIWSSNYDRLPLVREICGDVDGNMTVDAADLQLLLAHIFAGTQVADECICDVDGSGTINIMDARLLLNHIADRGAYPLNCAC